MTDNGAAMIAAETTEGLARLGIVHQTTLPYTPEQNGKQEVFWGQVEGRLMAMLEGEQELTLELLNRATQAWVEQEYHRTRPQRDQGDAARALPRRARASAVRARRAMRCAAPSAWRSRARSAAATAPSPSRASASRSRPRIARSCGRRCASRAGTSSSVDLVDPRAARTSRRSSRSTRQQNAERRRRALADASADARSRPRRAGIAPLLRQLMAEYAATGLPPAYRPAPAPHRPTSTDDDRGAES